MQSATFKNIKSLAPLLDRVLVQRFKPESVSRESHCVEVVAVPDRCLLLSLALVTSLPLVASRFLPPQKTATGIFLPSSATQSPLPEATVIAVGPGAPRKDGSGELQQVSVKPGDRVLLPGWGGNAIKLGDDEYFLFKDSEILAKINE